MCPLEMDELLAWRRSGFSQYPQSEDFLNWLKTSEDENKNPYYYRDKFSRKKYNWENNRKEALELGRAFYHMAQRRGFKSNRLDQSDETVLEKLRNDIELAVLESADLQELKMRIDELFAAFDLEDKLVKDLNETEKKIRSIDRKIQKLFKAKAEFDTVKEEIIKILHNRKNLGQVERAIMELNEEMEKAGATTLGQYFWILYQKDRSEGKNKIRNHYTHREKHYEKEFETIAKTQELPAELKKALHRAIFFQRPLKSQKGLVGMCTLEPDKPRCPISRPEFEEFRMYQLLSSIRIAPNEESPKWRKLTKEEREALIPRFYLKRKHLPFSDLIQTLSEYMSKVSGKKITIAHRKSGEAQNADYLINYYPDQNVSGNPVSSELKSFMGPDWKEKRYEYTEIKNGKTKKHNVGYEDIWHVLFTFEDEEHLYRYAKDKLGLEEKDAKRFSRINLPLGYASLSLKAIRKILPYLSRGLVYSHAVFMANISRAVKPEVWQDPEKRKDIEEGVGFEIERHSRLVRALQAGNALISHSIENRENYSDVAEAAFKKDLEKHLKEAFGSSVWSKLPDKEELFDEVWAKVKEQLDKAPGFREFLKIPRLDEQIINFLKDNEFLRSEEAKKYLYHPSDLQKFRSVDKKIKTETGPVMIRILPEPKNDSVKNPVLMRAMYQLRKLINTLLEKGIVDNETRVQVEMAREVNDSNKRAAYRAWQTRLQNENQQIEEILQEFFREEGKSGEVMPDDIMKAKLWAEQVRDEKGRAPDLFIKGDLKTRYKLWKEQKGKCLYTGESISLTKLFDGVSYDIEHTIPRSRSWDNSLMNKTIASSKFNRDTKKNQTPYELMEKNLLNSEELEARLRPWKERIEHLRKEVNKIKTGGIEDKEVKDRLIQKRHLLRFELDYWEGKYNRFFMKEINDSFKNSQITDTGLITRFAREYLGCVFERNGFPNVRVVNGTAVAEFRKAWGLQSYFQKKSRMNHVHHAIDAMVIASITREKYDAFAEIWRKEEEESEKREILKDLMRKTIPWTGFRKDVLSLEEKLPVVHRQKDKLPIQNRKKLRKRRRIQYVLKTQLPEYMAGKKEGKDYFIIEKDRKKYYKIPIYQQGDTVRGSLHQESFYGAIAQDATGEVKRDKNEKIIPQFVIRKALDALNEGDVKKIVDPRIREIVQHDRIEAKKIDNEIKELEKAKKPELSDEAEAVINQKLEELKAERAKLFHIPPRPGKTKYTPIRKVRIYAHINNDIPAFKKHAAPFLSEKEYKQSLHVANDENYCMVIYQNPENPSKRAYELIKNIDAGHYFRRSRQKDRKKGIIQLYHSSHYETGWPILNVKGKDLLIKKGMKIILLRTIDESPQFEDQNWINSRLYIVTGFDDDGIKLMHHQEARPRTEVIKHMNLVINKSNLLAGLDFLGKNQVLSDIINYFKRELERDNIDFQPLFKKMIEEIKNIANTNDPEIKKLIKSLKPSKLTTPKGGDVVGRCKDFPYVKFKVSNFNGLFEKIHFLISEDGNIQIMK